MSHKCTTPLRILSGRFVGLGVTLGLLGTIYATGPHANGQAGPDPELASRLQQLTDAVNRTQSQLEQSQRQLEELRTELSTLQQQIAELHGSQEGSSSAAQLSAAVDQIREQQQLEETQIATHEQAKVETESRYPLKLNGLVLMNGFVNRTQVDNPANPSIVLEGRGSTGATLRQTVLGFNARGPHVFGAESRADASVDFDGAALSTNTSSAYAGGLLRLRTIHGELAWNRTQAFFALDHPIIAPNTPSSLTAIAVPALAWSGNLWTWNPQVGLTQDLPVASARFRMQAALIDVMNPPPIYGGSGSSTATAVVSPSSAEASRWPGVESRLALLSGEETSGLQVGIGGLYAPHRSLGGTRFNTAAGTLDYRVPLPAHGEWSGSVYFGQALGGLGAGAFKDYVFIANPLSPTGYSFRTLDDLGGWTQFKERPNERLEFNVAFGTDQVPASQLRPYAGAATAYYLNLARNRTYTGNVIYSPSTYLMFSLEYRHLQSSPVNDYTATGDVIGIATGYRF
ncbi:MAG TPA: hypothetical protein VKR52_16590 [Terracidiphilus sp.]|nr:hypothetical protein [Terracidiphilus sp.]